MRVRFWGVRGSVPWATPDSIIHGCNTPCLEVRDERTDALLILDAGSGIVGLGQSLGSVPHPVPILLTHYHWDHTQGLPFFAPFFAPGWTPSIWAPELRGISLEWVSRIFESPYFPVPFEQLPNRPAVTLVEPRPFDIGGFRISVQPLNHPGGAFAYRIHGTSGDLVYATDHEFGNPVFDQQLAAFARGAAAIISDAHFTPEELPRYAGWGHAAWSQAAEFAARIDVGRLWLFHHKPGRSDGDLDRIEAQARDVFAATDAATEGVWFKV
jgi:phosphoribosyl 1,2-cyclic phosphodiesterase